MTYINLTGHEVHELDSNIRIEPSELVVRAICNTDRQRNEDGIMMHRSHSIYLDNPLPEPVEGVIYIVSALTHNAVPDYRVDVVAPQNVERRRDGTIRGCRGFRTK